jgi:F-type H+-transporting ATPase subunit b
MKTRNLIATIIALALAMPATAFAAEGGGEGGGSWLMLLFFVINFALFVIVLVYFARPAARSFFSSRASGIRSNLDRLQAALNEAQDYANRAAAKMARLEEEAAQLVRELNAETAFQVARIREGAAAAAQRIRHDTELTTAAIADAAQRRVRERLAAAAANVARELIARSFEASDQGRLVDSFMDKLREEAR